MEIKVDGVYIWNNDNGSILLNSLKVNYFDNENVYYTWIQYGYCGRLSYNYFKRNLKYSEKLTNEYIIKSIIK